MVIRLTAGEASLDRAAETDDDVKSIRSTPTRTACGISDSAENFSVNSSLARAWVSRPLGYDRHERDHEFRQSPKRS